MKTKQTGGQAFPRQDSRYDGQGGGRQEEGMTLRDYFAAKGMQAIITGEMSSGSKLEPGDHEHAAKAAYMIADAMLKAREVENEN